MSAGPIKLVGPHATSPAGGEESHIELKDSSSDDKLEVLVVDSGAIIRGHGTNFHRRARRFVTVQEVLGEIRDSKARELLATLPYELEVRTPSEESMTAVASFAKKSGDFAALSLTDIKLIALTYTLEKETTGGASIRIDPPRNHQLHAKGPSKKSAALQREGFPEGPDGTVFDGIIRSLSESCDCAKEIIEDGHSHVHGEVNNKPEDNSSSDESDGKEESERHNNNTEDNILAGTDSSISVSPLFPLTQDNTQDNTQDDTQDTTKDKDEEIQDLEFPSLSVNESKNSLGSVGPRYASNWVAVAMKDSAKPFSNKIQRNEVPQIFPSKLQVTNKPPLKESSTTKSTNDPANDYPEGMSMPSKIISGSSSGYSAAASARSALEDDGEGWINSTNFKTALEVGGQFPGENLTRKKVLTEQAKVACITTDFSMQNVMLQMGLHLVSVDGLAITTVKQWVLRCMACYQVHYKMDLLFCEKCGANHMSRVSCTIDAETGLLKLHLKKNYQPNTRGKIYSLPKPGKQGRYEGEILLRGDQLQQGIWLQKKMAVQRNLKSAFGEDVTADVGLHVNKGVRIKVGLGSRNPNAEKGRERRGKPRK